jgi:hypothetical protein
MFTPRVAIAVVVAGIVGTIANSIVVAIAVDLPLAGLILSPGRNLVAILVAAALPVFFLRVGGIAAWVAGLATLAMVPSILAKLVFGVAAPWPFVLAVNGVYAIAATLAYVAVAGVGRAAANP